MIVADSLFENIFDLLYPYKPLLNSLEFFQNAPTPQAKNSAFQQELDKADALYKKTIGEAIQTIHRLAAVRKETIRLIMQGEDPPLYDELKTELDRSIEETIPKILDFIQLLKTNENPSAEERHTFWTYVTEGTLCAAS